MRRSIHSDNRASC